MMYDLITKENYPKGSFNADKDFMDVFNKAKELTKKNISLEEKLRLIRELNVLVTRLVTICYDFKSYQKLSFDRDVFEAMCFYEYKDQNGAMVRVPLIFTDLYNRTRKYFDFSQFSWDCVCFASKDTDCPPELSSFLNDQEKNKKPYVFTVSGTNVAPVKFDRLIYPSNELKGCDFSGVDLSSVDMSKLSDVYVSDCNFKKCGLSMEQIVHLYRNASCDVRGNTSRVCIEQNQFGGIIDLRDLHRLYFLSSEFYADKLNFLDSKLNIQCDVANISPNFNECVGDELDIAIFSLYYQDKITNDSSSEYSSELEWQYFEMRDEHRKKYHYLVEQIQLLGHLVEKGILDGCFINGVKICSKNVQKTFQEAFPSLSPDAIRYMSMYSDDMDEILRTFGQPEIIENHKQLMGVLSSQIPVAQHEILFEKLQIPGILDYAHLSEEERILFAEWINLICSTANSSLDRTEVCSWDNYRKMDTISRETLQVSNKSADAPFLSTFGK